MPPTSNNTSPPASRGLSPAGTFSGIPSHLRAMFRGASSRVYGLDYKAVGLRFFSIIHTLEPDDFDESKLSWPAVLEAELRPVLETLSDENGDLRPVGVKALRAWVSKRYPVIYSKVPSQRWQRFAMGAAEAVPDLQF